jgi:SAM-dependent methyltransferase
LSRLRRALRRLLASPPESSTDYRIVDASEAPLVESGWGDADVARQQDTSYRKLLADMRAGRARADLRAAGNAVRDTGLKTPRLLEIGCGSGYYADVLSFLTGDLSYTGLDRSRAMLTLGRSHDPAAQLVQGRSEALPFASGSFDVTFDGVALMHAADPDASIAESRRVASRWCVFHTVPLCGQRPTTRLRKQAYGGPVEETIFNERDLLERFTANGLRVHRSYESIAYDLHAVLRERSWTTTYLCQVEA